MKNSYPFKYIAIFSALVLTVSGIVAVSGGFSEVLDDSNSQTEEDYNVMVVTVDSLRADHLECYGYERNTSPNTCGLADRSVVFENAYATSPWSHPSYVSLLTGLWPFRHGARSAEMVDGGLEFLPETLQDGGYRTEGYVDGSFLRPFLNMDQGYDKYVSYRNGTGEMGNAEQIIDDTTQSVRTTKEPFFQFLMLMDVHSPFWPKNTTAFQDYSSPGYNGSLNLSEHGQGDVYDLNHSALSEQEVDRMIAGYDANIRYTDHHVGRLVDTLNETGKLDNTIVVITADHGEAFREHGSWIGHLRNLYDEQIKVPLIVYHPDLEPQRIEERVSLADIKPTLLDMVSIEESAEMDGRSLLPLIKEGTYSERLIYSSTVGPGLRFDKSGVIKNDMKLIWDHESGEIQLFNLSSDPGELNDISDSEESLVESLKQTISNIRENENISQSRQAAREQREVLQKLGYISSE